MIFDKLHTIPIDKQARRVTGKGYHYEPMRRPTQNETWSAPPKPEKPRPFAATDYTGFRRGYMTAMYWYKSNKTYGSQWVCRCDCGNYELRRIKSWWSNKTMSDSCVICYVTYCKTHGKSPEN